MFNRRQIEVDGFYIDPSREEATELTFSINNISPKSITVNKISFMCDGIEVQSFDDHKDEPEYVSGPLGIKIEVPSLDNGIPDILNLQLSYCQIHIWNLLITYPISKKQILE